jgi:hypothetical protein
LLQPCLQLGRVPTKHCRCCCLLQLLRLLSHAPLVSACLPHLASCLAAKRSSLACFPAASAPDSAAAASFAISDHPGDGFTCPTPPCSVGQATAVTEDGCVSCYTGDSDGCVANPALAL